MRWNKSNFSDFLKVTSMLHYFITNYVSNKDVVIRRLYVYIFWKKNIYLLLLSINIILLSELSHQIFTDYTDFTYMHTD